MLRPGFVAGWLMLVLTGLTLLASADDTESHTFEVRAEAGTNVHLPCSIPEPIPEHVTIVWRRKEEILTVGDLTFISDPRISVIRDDAHPNQQSLWIRSVTSTDTGMYECQASTPQPKTFSVKLIVERVRLMGGGSDVYTGANFTLECTIGKISPRSPYNHWHHNGKKLSESDRLIMQPFQNPETHVLYSHLTIVNASPPDRGQYTCKLPYDTASIDINIKESPHLPPSALHVTGVTFSSVSLTWSYDDEELKDEFHYILRHRPDHSDEEYTEIRDISTNSYSIDGLLPMTEYAFQVLAVKKTGEISDPSPTILVTVATISFSLLRACESGHLGVVKDLLALDPDIDEGDGMYLKMASQMGHLDVVEFLLQEGADPDADEDGEAVQEAAKNGHTEVVRALLEAGADANVGDGMHWAVANNRPEIVKLLDEYKSDVNKPLPERPWKNPETGANYGFGWTALHVAARWGKTSMVDLLYHLGSDLAARDPNGDTPLHIAVKYPQIWFVRELLKYCPDLTLQNNDGKTVIDLVEDLPHAIYNSLSSEEGVKLRNLVANITVDKIKTSSNTEDAAAALEDEVEALVESNKTISDLVDAVASTDSHVDYVLQEVFEDTIYLEIEDAFADHLCTYEESGEWKAELDVKHEATCTCVPGKGPTLQLKPLSQSHWCGDPSGPEVL